MTRYPCFDKIAEVKKEPLASHPPAFVRRGNSNLVLSIFLFGERLGSLFLWRCVPISNYDLMINEEIRDKEVRLIDEKGNQMGVVTIAVAMSVAEERGLDLVKIAPQVNPPVCKIMDYGKYRFEQIKRDKEQRKNQKVIEIKEIRLSATIDTHDMEVKAKACTKFLQNGDKVKVSIRFRGRQITHGDIGLDVMNTFYEMVKDSANIDRPAKQEGRNMFMVLTPKN